MEKDSASQVPVPFAHTDGKGSWIKSVGAKVAAGFGMGGGCFHHLTRPNIGSLSSASSVSVSRLPLSLCVCTRVDMFNKIMARKEGHPAQG